MRVSHVENLQRTSKLDRLRYAERRPSCNPNHAFAVGLYARRNGRNRANPTVHHAAVAMGAASPPITR
jgi:hypothetical protein